MTDPARLLSNPGGISRLLRPFARVATGFPVLALFWACGGQATPEPKTAEQEEGEAPPEDARESEADAQDSEASAPPSDPCADGTCFACGTSMCLPGWYCDENAKGGAACSWLPDCAESPSCRCITKVLGSDCSCKEEGGGPHVSCG